jgi:hypothetical protein
MKKEKLIYYIVCDPCYITSDTEWNKMGKETEWKLETLSFPRKVAKGIELMFIIGTRHGDGVYFGGEGKKIGVDSGTLCVAKITDLKEKELPKLENKSSYFIAYPDYLKALKFCITLACDHF